MNEREIALQVVERSLGPLKQIDDLYRTAEMVQSQFEARVQEENARRQKWGIKRRIAFSLKGLIGASVAGFFLRVILWLKIKSELVLVFPFIAAFAVIIAVWKPIDKLFAGKSPVPEWEAEKNRRLQELAERIEYVASSNIEAINALPRDYRYYYAASFLEQALANYRADSMKEALNLYEDHVHKLKMESYQAENLRINQEQAGMIAEIERNTHQSAVANQIEAAAIIFAYLNN